MDFERVKEYMIQRLKRGLAPNLYYHGVHHTIDVMRAAEEIAEAENVKGLDKIILMTAALFHDVGFLIRYKENEDISVGMCWNILPRFNYTQSEIMMIAHIIMSTTIPQNPVNKLIALCVMPIWIIWDATNFYYRM